MSWRKLVDDAGSTSQRRRTRLTGYMLRRRSRVMLTVWTWLVEDWKELRERGRIELGPRTWTTNAGQRRPRKRGRDSSLDHRAPPLRFKPVRVGEEEETQSTGLAIEFAFGYCGLKSAIDILRQLFTLVSFGLIHTWLIDTIQFWKGKLDFDQERDIFPKKNYKKQNLIVIKLCV